MMTMHRDCDGQSASNLHTGAIVINGSASKVTISEVEVAHTGGFGIVTQGAVSDVTLNRLNIHDIGAGGVNVEKPTENSVTNLALIDSEIHDGGHVYLLRAQD
jgi:hypothetical protein